MAQHDYVIANGSGSAVRGDLNNALAAIVSQNSGATEPTDKFAYMWWADTSAGVLKLRNAANNAWITLRELDGTLTIEAGSASAPGLYFAGDATNTGIYSPGADQFGIATNGTARVYVGSTGNVGVGTTSPSAKLQVNQNTDTATALAVVSASASATITADFASLYLQNTNTTTNNYNSIGFVNDQGAFSASILGIYTDHTTNAQSGAIAFATRDSGSYSERARIDSSGRILVGTSSYSSNGIAVFQGNTSSSTGPGAVDIRLGTTRPTAADTSIGFLRFMSTSDAASGYHYASISAASDGASSSDTDIPGRLVFSTTADAAATPTERMRITNGGTVGINNASPDANAKLDVVGGIKGAVITATAVASTSGTSIDFTSIPSWVKRITVMFDGVSTNGTSIPLIQIGDSGGIETTGYVSSGTSASTAVATTDSTAGFIIYAATAANISSGHYVLTLISGTTWVGSGVFKNSTSVTCYNAGNKSLSGTLDRVRITTTNGTDTFDAGSINIMYEG